VKGFLLDENVPNRLKVTPSLPVFSVRELLGPATSDAQVWRLAQERELVILTKDADFSGLILPRRPPPWVVQLRIGNVQRTEYHQLLNRIWSRVEALLPEHKLIRVFADRLEAFK
jgi:predicted nuclease of predicted toxin-antitoxin system